MVGGRLYNLWIRVAWTRHPKNGAQTRRIARILFSIDTLDVWCIHLHFYVKLQKCRDLLAPFWQTMAFIKILHAHFFGTFWWRCCQRKSSKWRRGEPLMSFESFGKQLVFVEENLGKPKQILEFCGCRATVLQWKRWVFFVKLKGF